MKRRLALFLCAMMLLGGFIFTACTSTAAGDVLSHQQYPFTVVGELVFGSDEYTISLAMTAPMQATLSFLVPETLMGYYFTITPDGVTLSFGDITIPYTSNSVPGGSLLIPQMLSLTQAQLVNTQQTEQNSVPLTIAVFNTPHGEITLFVNNNSGLPLRIESMHNGVPVVFRIRELIKG